MRRILSVAAGIGCLFLLLSRMTMAQSGCTSLYNPGAGWEIEMCATDPNVPATMDVFLDGSSYGRAAFIRIYHQSEHDPGSPQIAVIYASAFIRLKQNADPQPPIPFGSSFILGPAYWADGAYYHNPQLTRLEIDTGALPGGPLRLRAQGSNHDFDVAYELTLPEPEDELTRLHVSQRYTATVPIAIDPGRRATAEGFKLVQISSMFINEEGSCAGGHTGCHDSDAARFIGVDLARRQVAFSTLSPPSFIFSTPVPLGNTWLDALHGDDQGWQGNTPNVRIVLDALPEEHTVTPQGWITSTNDPNDDNAGLWLHDDGPASTEWKAGQSGRVSYWLLAQDDPPEPWATLGLRDGLTFLDFEGSDACVFVHNPAQGTGGSAGRIAGYQDTALQLDYDLGNADGNWAQLRCDFDPPLDLSAYDHLRFDWRGDPAAANSLEVALVNPGEGGGEHIFARGYNHLSHRPWWGQLVVPFSFLQGWAEGSSFDPGQVSAFFVSVVKDGDDEGGAGRFAVDNVNAFNVRSRTVPDSFATTEENAAAAAMAATWLAGQQQPSGLLKSWAEEANDTAHIYDQALALLVFIQEGMWDEADALASGLATAQNGDGSWYKSYDAGNGALPCIHCHKWEGDIAWAVYALSRYLALGGTDPEARAARDGAAAWLAGRIDADNGCLVIDHTEGTIDAWWALQAAGAAYRRQARGLERCLLTIYWDDEMGRFKGGMSWQQPYLDNQTWGAAFLKAVGEEEKARRALSYAWEVLLLPAQGGQLFGLAGQAGPWAVWNEGTAQYVAVGGAGAGDLRQELLAQQRADGAMPGGPDPFSGGGVWITEWHGVAPTAWLAFGLAGGPLRPSPVFWGYLPMVARSSAGGGATISW